MFIKSLSLRYFFCLNHNLIKTLHAPPHYEDANFHKMKYNLKGHVSLNATFMLLWKCYMIFVYF